VEEGRSNVRGRDSKESRGDSLARSSDSPIDSKAEISSAHILERNKSIDLSSHLLV